VLTQVLGNYCAKKLHRNITAIYGLAFFHSFMVIVPVIVPFFMSKGLSLAEIFYLQAIFATTIVIFEAPSGYFADIFGRRAALLIGSVIHGSGFLLLNFVDGLSGLIVFEIAVGIAASLLSGADLAVLYDTQRALEDEDSSEHSNGIAHLGFIRSSAEALGALLGGVLALWSFDLMVLTQSVAAWMCLALALIVVEPPYHDVNSSECRIGIGEILRHMFASDPILRHVVIAYRCIAWQPFMWPGLSSPIGRHRDYHWHGLACCGVCKASQWRLRQSSVLTSSDATALWPR